MFSKAELLLLAKSLAMFEKSCKRLASREGQPDAVAAEYLKAQAAIIALQKKVVMEMEKVK